MGLLDAFRNMSPDQAQGLLSAGAQMMERAGDPTRQFSVGQAMGGGINSYLQSLEVARRRKMEEEQAAQIAQQRELQLQSARAQMAEQQEAREREQAIRSAFMGSVLTPEQQAAQLPGGPTMANAARIGEMPGGLDQKRLHEQLMRIDPVYALKMQREMAPAPIEYDTTERIGIDDSGKPIKYMLSKTGQKKIIEGVAPRDELEFRDGGNAVLGLDKFKGGVVSQVAKGISPAQVAIGTRAAAKLGTGANGSLKPMPATALKMQQAELEAIGTASGINAELRRIQGQITKGTLDFGPVSNLINRGRNAAGMSNEESRNFASFQSSLEKMRNDSLRLNAGVQTDGDAQRAWNELFANINDKGVVSQRLQEIVNLNERAVKLRRMNVDSIRANYGRDPVDTSQYESPSTASSSVRKYNPKTGKIE